MKKILILLFALGLVIAGCSGSSSSSSDRNRNKDRNEDNNNNNNSAASDEEVADSDFGSLEMQLEALGSFEASFVMRFEGESNWTYSVVTRFDGEAFEYALAMTGLNSRQDPGDIRLVYADGSSQMAGEGTDGLCAQFPDSFDSGVRFLGPTDVVDTAMFGGEPDEEDGEEIAGLETQGYSLGGEDVGGWQAADILFWLDGESGAVMRYEFELVGEDPVFGAGEGTLVGAFIVEDVGAQEIEPVLECVIDLPMPDDASEILQLPGLVVYETSMTVEELGVYYHEVLIEAGWLRLALPQTGKSGEMVIDYITDTLTLDINIEPLGAGAKVEMYLNDR